MIEVVLIGGGHAHVEVLRSAAMKPIEGVRLTVVARDTVTPYSGMLPGYIAGIYSYAEAHIDLRPLCARAGARLIHASAAGLDADRYRVLFNDRPPMSFDHASIDTGSTPVVAGIEGADAFSIGVKPVDLFLDHWERIEADQAARSTPYSLAVIGGGAGGVEVCLGLFHRLTDARRKQGNDNGAVTATLISDSEALLPRHNNGVRQRMDRALSHAGVTVLKNHRAAKISRTHVTCDNGAEIAADLAVTVTGAAAATWLKGTGLALDADGFIAVDACLRSTSHPAVMAAGDIAAFQPEPLIKNGVYAVRQGPKLATNIRRLADGLEPEAFRPQGRTMALISTGERHAIGSWGPLAFQGDWVWRWKDRIDRTWMAKYQALPAMKADDTPMRCGGCGAKVPSAVLGRALKRLDIGSRAEVLIGLDAPDDAAAIQPAPGEAVVQTVDQFPTFVDDPYAFGRIAAVHALSDLHAMAVRPVAALALAGLLPGSATMMEDDLVQMLSGALSILNAEGCALVGGHTSETERASLGFAVTGFSRPDALVHKAGLRPGDALILTKPLGTGTLFAAEMCGVAPSVWIEMALAGMQRSNGPAARVLVDHDVSAMTDVTGFGLAGHLLEMLQASGVGARLQSGTLPIYPGATDLLAQGIASTLHPGNVAALEGMIDAQHHNPLLFDPQTAGGLLAGVARDQSTACLEALQNGGDPAARIIGEVTEAAEPAIEIVD